ncbi:MAG: hypothetical protein QM743_11785 [Chitinophagaceae bacterium]
MKRIFTSLLLLLAAFSSRATSFSGIYYIPGSYLTLTDFLTDFNSSSTTIAGTILVNITQDQSAPAGGWVAGSDSVNPKMVAPYSITFDGKGHVFTANSGTGGHDAILTVQGLDNVTFQNMNLVEKASNTTATSRMEHGFSIVKLNNNDGCKGVSIIDCEITLNNANTTAASGVSHYGTAGVFVGNCTYLSTTALAPTLEDGTHNVVYLLRDTMHNVNYGFYGYGNAVAADGSAFNDKNITVQGCRIANFTHDGVYLSYFNNDNIAKNYINNTDDGGTAPVTNYLYGVRYLNPNSALQTSTNWTCSDNNINLTINSAGTYAATGILTQLYGTGTTDIKNDTVQLTSSGTSAQLFGIFSQNNNGTQNIKSNVIQNFSTQTTNAQAIIGIFGGGYAVSTTYSGLGLSSAIYPTSNTIDGNIIQNFNVSSGTSNLTRIFAIEDDNFTTAPSVITNNKILKINANANSYQMVGYGTLYVWGTAVARTATVTGNVIDGMTVSAATNTTPLVGFSPACTYPSGSVGNTITFSKNKVSNINGGAAVVNAYRLEYAVAATINADTVNNITVEGSNVFGVSSGNSGYSPATVTITKSKFTNIKCNSTTGGWSAVGCYPLSGSTATLTTFNFTNNLFQNIITADASGLAFGLYSTSGTATYNINTNMISDVIAASNTTNYSSSMGMYLANTGTDNIYYNTINMATTAKTGYGATGILYNTAGTNKIQNNIVRVNVTAGAANNTVAMRGSAGVAKSAPSTSAYGSASNIYYVPKGSNNFLYAEGGSSVVNGYAQSGLTPDATKNIVNDTFFNSECGRSSFHKFMQTASAKRDTNTFTEDNLTGSGGVYTPTGISYAESRATDNSIALDFFTISRPFGSSDIGAAEFAGSTIPSMNITIVSSTGFDTACTGNLPILRATHPSYFSHTSYQWYVDTVTRPIPGATDTFVSVGTTGGKYYIYIYDSVTGCTYKSNPFRMTVVPPPTSVITYYDSLNFCQSSAVVVQANKGYRFSYRWMRNGSYLAGETDDHLVIDKSGTYQVEINTPLGCPSVSPGIVVTVYPLPTPFVYYVRDRVLGVTQKFYTYQWYRNNVKIPGSDATNALYYVLDDAAYSVEVTDSNGCTAKSEVYLYSLAVNEHAMQSSVKVFPNPVTDVLHITADVPVSVSLTDITGRMIISKAAVNTMDMSQLSEGIYLLNIYDSEDKLIKVEKVNRVR